ncbi:hypothetical protein [Campylobacter gastrosuis]|uniref:DUF3102 domain-containing protein n=1 Tax=Campylobacter gastrosuis TaxID=2974576 RepID=A0ABT7HQ31_9BACT|nr:hypothetical protein [Campylobacter gastrosuis]MDL0088504.1 hypothetical protein [Campylobacter gastrosuis]
MNEIQKIAFDIYLESAVFENDFKPISEEALSKRLKAQGLEASSSSINRWKNKFNWQTALEEKVRLAMSENKDVKALILASGLKTAVKDTKVDIDRNEVLLAGSYQFFEIEESKILAKQQNGEKISKEEIELMKFIATLTSTRKDKMLDRLALMPRDAVSAEEVLNRLETIEVEVEDE